MLKDSNAVAHSLDTDIFYAVVHLFSVPRLRLTFTSWVSVKRGIRPGPGSLLYINIYNITKAKRALCLANSASTICPWVYAADVLNN